MHVGKVIAVVLWTVIGGALTYRPVPTLWRLLRGADPATILGAVTDRQRTLSGYAFAGLLRGSRALELIGWAIGERFAGAAQADHWLAGHVPREMADEGCHLRRSHRLLQRGGRLPSLYCGAATPS